ncbi:MAG: phosphatase PAP2 family protein [Ginsengibacter sp.]
MKKCVILLATIFFSQLLFAQEVSTPAEKIDAQQRLSFAVDNANEDAASKKIITDNEALKNSLLKEFRSADHLKNTSVFSPYRTSFWGDGLAIAGAVGVTFLGYELISNKKDLTPAELAAKTKDKLPFFDRFCAGNFSPQADRDSYILFDADYALPFIAALIDKDQRAKFGQVAVLYIETIAITGSMYTLSAGLVYRSRPFVYGDKAPMAKRLDRGAQRSFYGGHVAGTAASFFFISKVYHDFHPNSKLTPYLYATSGALTGLMAYMRIQAGYHFFSDCLLSSVIGTATGILIPQFHKNKNFKNVSVTPEIFNNGASGFAMTYRF